MITGQDFIYIMAGFATALVVVGLALHFIGDDYE